MNQQELARYEKAGAIARDTIVYAREIIQKGAPILELAAKIEAKIIELGGQPAFPINMSIDEIAAHATPSYDSSEKARGLLKVDIGVHVDGCIADTAFSVDLENSAVNKKLIEAAQAGLAAAITHVKKGVRLGVIGGAIDASIKPYGVNIVRNLTGHSIEPYDVHAGATLPNYDTGSPETLGDGVYAIEPFTTTGHGSVRDGKLSGIYQFAANKPIRDLLAREAAAFIVESYQTLPFASRWIHAKFGTRGLLALRQLEQAGILYQYPQLVEVSGAPVAQAEHTFVVTKDKTVVIT